MQHADVLPRAGRAAAAGLQRLPQPDENGWQLPVAVDRGLVEGRRLLPQHLEEVQGVEDPLAAAVAARVGRDLLAAGHDDDAVGVALDRHRAEGVAARDAVGVAVEADGLELIDLARLQYAGVEGALRRRQRGGPVALEAHADRLGVLAARALARRQAAAPQVGVERRQVRDAGDRRRPLPLEVVDAVLDARLLGGRGRQAEPGRQRVVRDEGCVAGMERPLAPLQELDGDGPGVVPPQFGRHGAEEGERLDQAVQDGLGPLGRQGEGERGVGVAPGDEQDGDLPPAAGEVHVDVAEVRFGAVARRVLQGDEGLAAVAAESLEVAAYLVIAAAIAVLGHKATEDLLGRVALLAWGGRILREDLLDDGPERAEDGGGPWRRRGGRLGVCQGFEDRLGRVVEFVGDLADGPPVAAELSNACVLVHRQHPVPPAAATRPHAGAVLRCFPSDADRVFHPDADHHGQYQSGESDRRGRITRRGPALLRKLLVECARVMLRYNGWARAVYARLSRGKARKKQAIVALARRLLVRCWAMLRDGTPRRAEPRAEAEAAPA